MMIAPHKAFRPGAGLWIIPDLSQSRWARRLDWYFNGSISRAESHTPSRLSDDFKKILASEEISAPIIEFKRDALLIETSSWVPSPRTLVLQFTGELEAWLKKCQTIQNQLGEKHVRIFLPQGANLGSAEKVKLGSNMDIEFIPDGDE